MNNSFDLRALFQKWIASFLAFLFLLFPSLAPDKAQATLTLDEPATTQSEFISFTLENKTEQELSYGIGSYTLEQKTPDGWQKLSEVPGYSYIKILYVCPPGGKSNVTLDPAIRYGKLLDAGTYRVSVACNPKEDGTASVVSTEFTVTAA